MKIELLQGIGGRDRDRTGDPLLAKQVLSQLSYTPIEIGSLETLSIMLQTFCFYRN
jgi:hypothetical protein